MATEWQPRRRRLDLTSSANPPGTSRLPLSVNYANTFKLVVAPRLRVSTTDSEGPCGPWGRRPSIHRSTAHRRFIREPTRGCTSVGCRGVRRRSHCRMSTTVRARASTVGKGRSGKQTKRRNCSRKYELLHIFTRPVKKKPWTKGLAQCSTREKTCTKMVHLTHLIRSAVSQPSNLSLMLNQHQLRKHRENCAAIG